MDRTESALLSGLEKGLWTDTLPGVRILCSSLQVSPPTLQAATARLLERGILVYHGPRRRLGIAPGLVESTSIAPEPTARALRVVCLTNDTLPEMSHTRLEILSRLRMENRHWDFRHHVIPIKDAKKPRLQWDRLADTEEPDALVIFGGMPAIARWSIRRKLRTVFIGGEPGAHPIPTIGMNPIRPIIDSINEFASYGHQHICMPMFGLFPRLEKGIRDAFRDAFLGLGIPFDESWNTPSAPQHDPDVILNVLTRISRVRVPTAIIAMSWVEFVAIQSFLSERRLSIPHDVSAIVLAGSESLEWFRPRLTHFDYSVGRITRNVRIWIDRNFPFNRDALAVPAQIVRGDSVGAPRS
ncbi:substrate-binding domain-containing protein [Luteolibacter marinus]|uniref:substrate-binding domain-containing protein n=1 Tax=Luteolibacter marinus TaxID=2776705 RepID=UPI001867A8EA